MGEERETLNANARAVLDALKASETHPTALEVYELVKRQRPRIGLATVYRALHQLTKQGRVRELGYGGECSRYDAHITRHDHGVCTECGALLDIPTEIALPFESLQAAAQAVGIQLDSHEVRIYGRCATCQQHHHP